MISNLAKPLIILLFLISNSHASEVSFHGKFVQGGIIIGHSSLAEKVFFDDRELQISNDGNFMGDLRSACYSPHFKKVIGIAMIKEPFCKVSETGKLEIEGKTLSLKVCDLPFI